MSTIPDQFHKTDNARLPTPHTATWHQIRQMQQIWGSQLGSTSSPELRWVQRWLLQSRLLSFYFTIYFFSTDAHIGHTRNHPWCVDRVLSICDRCHVDKTLSSLWTLCDAIDFVCSFITCLCGTFVCKSHLWLSEVGSRGHHHEHCEIPVCLGPLCCSPGAWHLGGGYGALSSK